MNFYLIELLKGHGCYRPYLFKYDDVVDEAFSECHNERETAEHVFFTCPPYVDQRNCLERTIGLQVTPNNIVLLTSCDNWYAVCGFAWRILTE